MPHVNFWIKKEDWEAWESIKDKPAFIHSALAGVSVSGSTPERGLVDPPRAVQAQTEKVVGQQPAKKDICKEHGVSKDTCKLMKHS